MYFPYSLPKPILIHREDLLSGHRRMHQLHQEAKANANVAALCSVAFCTIALATHRIPSSISPFFQRAIPLSGALTCGLWGLKERSTYQCAERWTELSVALNPMGVSCSSSLNEEVSKVVNADPARISYIEEGLMIEPRFVGESAHEEALQTLDSLESIEIPNRFLSKQLAGKAVDEVICAGHLAAVGTSAGMMLLVATLPSTKAYLPFLAACVVSALYQNTVGNLEEKRKQLKEELESEDSPQKSLCNRLMHPRFGNYVNCVSPDSPMDFLMMWARDKKQVALRINALGTVTLDSNTKPKPWFDLYGESFPKK